MSALAEALVAAQARAVAALARGPKRYRRTIATPKQWAAIAAAKGDSCRLCGAQPVEYHHLISRGAGLGDDVEPNIVPLCSADHELVTRGHRTALYRLGEALTDAERAYVLDKGTEAWVERAFGGAVTR